MEKFLASKCPSYGATFLCRPSESRSVLAGTLAKAVAAGKTALAAVFDLYQRHYGTRRRQVNYGHAPPWAMCRELTAQPAAPDPDQPGATGPWPGLPTAAAAVFVNMQSDSRLPQQTATSAPGAAFRVATPGYFWESAQSGRSG